MERLLSEGISEIENGRNYQELIYRAAAEMGSCEAAWRIIVEWLIIRAQTGGNGPSSATSTWLWLVLNQPLSEQLPAEYSQLLEESMNAIAGNPLQNNWQTHASLSLNLMTRLITAKGCIQ